MKEINMITSVPPARQQEINRWFIITTTLCILLISYTSISTYYNYQALKQLNHTKHRILEKLHSLHETEQRLISLKKEEETLNKHIATLDKHQATTRQIPRYTKTILRLLPPESSLESLIIDQQQLTLIIQCTGIPQVLTYIKQLSQEKSFQNCSLTTLQRSSSHNNTMQATITGVLL